MSNTNASEDNIESPSTYGNKGYKEYRKKRLWLQVVTLRNKVYSYSRVLPCLRVVH